MIFAFLLFFLLILNFFIWTIPISIDNTLVYANIDFYSGILYQRLGITPDFFTPIFAMARVVGWLAHWIEQLQDNHIFRPTEIYEGEHDQSYLAISKRGLEI